MISEGSDRRPRGVTAGLVAGIIGIGCCVGPAVAALTGITSATVAIDAANSLYSEWGWAFKLAGFVAAAVAIGLALRACRHCRTRPLGIGRYALIVGVTGLVTYGSLYGLTTWFGGFGDEGAAAAEQPLSPLASVKDFLLPSTDGGVVVQVVATIVVAPIVLLLLAKRHRDLAWLTGGVIALWLALMGFRALH